MAAGAAAYILKQQETETVFGRPAKGRIAAVGFLVMYMMLVLASTVFDRKPGRNYQYEWELFWTWRAVFEGRTGLIREIFYNLLMLFPYGCLLPAALSWTSGRKSGEAHAGETWDRKQRNWALIVVLTAFCWSFFIELLQLVFKRGLFEFDDMAYNTLGAWAGYGAWKLFLKIKLKNMEKRLAKMAGIWYSS